MTESRVVFESFRRVSTVYFTSKSHKGLGWSGKGAGIVKVSEPTPNTLILNESGLWRQDGGKEIRFTNVFRWQLKGERLHLEHLRFGADNPVFLFEMAVDANGVWHEMNPHLCRDDCYRAGLRVEGERILVNWLVRGPRHDEVMDYVYY